MNGQNTKVNLPADYGLAFGRFGQNRSFMSPSKFVIGSLFMLDKEELDDKLKKFSNHLGISHKIFLEQLKKGMKKKGGDVDLIDREFNEDYIGEIEDYNTQKGVPYFRTAVRSKSDGDDVYHPQFPANEMPFSQGDLEFICQCEASNIGNIKSRGVVCPHIAALGLKIRDEGKEKVFLPFKLHNLGLEDMAAKVLSDYYIEGKTHFQINREILTGKRNIFATRLVRALAIENSDNNITYEVLRGKEKVISNHNSSSEQRNRLGSINRYLNKFSSQLKHNGIDGGLRGYSVEFGGTDDFECVATYFRRGRDEVIALCTWEDKPPLLVHKKLGDRMNVKESPLYRANFNPFHMLNKPFDSAKDDITRRYSQITIMQPHEFLIGSYMGVSKNIKEMYLKQTTRQSNLI